MTDEIKVGPHGVTSFVGPDAARLYKVVVLRAAIELHRDSGIIPTRGVTITKMYDHASIYTGVKYKRGQHDRAIADLTTWIELTKSSIPVSHD